MVPLGEHSFTWAAGEKTTTYLAAGPKEGPLLIFIHGWPAIAYTWKQQLETFASLGFRAVAPDMPGYGGSSARKITEDYCLEEINNSMVALLSHLNRAEAVWIGHDWGSPAVWSFAEHYPEKTTAVCGMAVPSHGLEIGMQEILQYVDRELYPEDKFPYGQWDYQQFYLESFSKATAWFEKDPAAFLRAAYSKGSPSSLGQRAFTSQVRSAGGWFGGGAEPDAKWKQIPEQAMCIDEDTYQKLVAAMQKTGFFGADSWYANHESNRKYFEKATNEGRLAMPVLFIEAKYDTICDTVNSRLAEPMRRNCAKLTESSIDSGHWVAQEKPAEVNGVIARWIVEEVPMAWPGYWGSKGFVKSKV